MWLFVSNVPAVEGFTVLFRFISDSLACRLHQDAPWSYFPSFRDYLAEECNELFFLGDSSFLSSSSMHANKQAGFGERILSL